MGSSEKSLAVRCVALRCVALRCKTIPIRHSVVQYRFRRQLFWRAQGYRVVVEVRHAFARRLA